jgi:hypothetical protein
MNAGRLKSEIKLESGGRRAEDTTGVSSRRLLACFTVSLG